MPRLLSCQGAAERGGPRVARQQSRNCHVTSSHPNNINVVMSACVQGGMCPTYCVAKALLNKAGQLLSADDVFKQRGVSVVAVCPGWCRCTLFVASCYKHIMQYLRCYVLGVRITAASEHCRSPPGQCLFLSCYILYVPHCYVYGLICDTRGSCWRLIRALCSVAYQWWQCAQAGAGRGNIHDSNITVLCCAVM